MKHFLENRLQEYTYLKNSKLLINQTKNREINNLEYMEELRTRDSLDLMSQQQKITFLEDKVRELSKLERGYVPFEEISKEVNINYENIESMSYASVINSNFKSIDTLAVFTVKWNDTLVDDNLVNKEKDKLYRWLKLKLKLDTLVVKQSN